VGLGSINECPGQVAFGYVSHWLGRRPCYLAALLSSHEFPRTDHSQCTRSPLDLDEYGTDIDDYPGVKTFANLVAYTESHLGNPPDHPTSADPVLADLASATAIAVRNPLAERLFRGGPARARVSWPARQKALYALASVSTVMPAPCRRSDRDKTVSPITGVRGLRPTIMAGAPPDA
jgi:hypothetical protein